MRGALTVKICGVRDHAGLTACVAAGVDFVGFNFVAGARRKITLQQARALRSAAGPCTPVALFRDADLADIEAVAFGADVGWIQLHGAEPPALCAALSARGRSVIKALNTATLPQACDYAPHVAAFLVDGPAPGSGVAWDEAELRGPLLAGRPLWLAGGLTPATLAARCLKVRPAGVDAASGVERGGVLAADLIAAFAHAARAAAAQMTPRGAP